MFPVKVTSWASCHGCSFTSYLFLSSLTAFLEHQVRTHFYKCAFLERNLIFHDVCLCTAESLCCSPETPIRWLIGCTPMENKKWEEKTCIKCRKHKTKAISELLKLLLSFSSSLRSSHSTAYGEIHMQCISESQLCAQSLSHVQLLWPHGQQPARLLCPRGPPSKNTGVGCRLLLQVPTFTGWTISNYACAFNLVWRIISEGIHTLRACFLIFSDLYPESLSEQKKNTHRKASRTWFCSGSVCVMREVLGQVERKHA